MKLKTKNIEKSCIETLNLYITIRKQAFFQGHSLKMCEEFRMLSGFHIGKDKATISRTLELDRLREKCRHLEIAVLWNICHDVDPMAAYGQKHWRTNASRS